MWGSTLQLYTFMSDLVGTEANTFRLKRLAERSAVKDYICFTKGDQSMSERLKI